MKNIFIRYFHGTLFFLLCFTMPVVSTAQENDTPSYPQRTTREVPDSVVSRMQKERDFLYANEPSYWQEKETRDHSPFLRWLATVLGSPVLKWTGYLLLGALVVFVLYQVTVVNNFFIFSRGKKKRNNTGADITADMSTDDMDKQINEAIQQEQYREAIRFLYLKTLLLLNERKQIVLHARSTNNDYISQMQMRPAGKEFKLLTRIYEYVWYGEHQPNAHQFSIVHQNFNQFIAST